MQKAGIRLMNACYNNLKANKFATNNVNVQIKKEFFVRLIINK